MLTTLQPLKDKLLHMNPVIENTGLLEQCREAFLQTSAGTGNNNTPFSAVCRKAMASFEKTGFPHIKQEAWRFTDLRPLLRKPFAMVNESQPTTLTREEIDQWNIAGKNALLLVFVNGRFESSLSDAEVKTTGFIAGSIRDHLNHPTAVEHLTKVAPFEDAPFVALNTALHNDCAFIHVASDTDPGKVVHIMHISGGLDDNTMSFPRTLVTTGKNSRLSLVQSFRTLNPAHTCLTVPVTEFVVGENSNVDLELIQNETGDAGHINHTQVIQHRDSRFSVNTLTLNGELVRNNLNIVLNGINCESHMYGLYLPGGNQHVDNQTFVDHASPHCHSNELYKGIVDDKAAAIFNGRIMVRQDAQKTNALQQNKNILLTDDAYVNAKPQLEIFADDVKCTHGATTGQLDEEALFYLRSRGIGEEQARAMLIHAFASDVVDNIGDDDLKKNLLQMISERLKQDMHLTHS